MSHTVYTGEAESNNQAWVVVSGGGLSEDVDLGWVPTAIIGIKETSNGAEFAMWSFLDGQYVAGYTIDGVSTDYLTGNFILAKMSPWRGDVKQDGSAYERSGGMGFTIAASYNESGSSMRLLCLR